MTLRDVLAVVAAELDQVTTGVASDGGIVWSRAGTPFAILNEEGAAAEFRLDSAVASAAIRTPDTVMSSRGPGWVLFRPATLDAHGADRATAWLRSACRHASTS